MSTAQFPTTLAVGQPGMPQTPGMTPIVAPPRREIPLKTRFKAAERVGFGRLLRVEARKLVDTTAYAVLMWVGLGITMLLVLGAAAIMAFLANKAVADGAAPSEVPVGWFTISTVTSIVPITWLGILAILSVSSEWGRRTALTTFALEPRRERTLLAKFLVVTIAALVVSILIYAFGAVFSLLTGAIAGIPVDWSAGTAKVLGFVLSSLLTVWFGLAMGLLIQNAPAALLAFLILPWVWSTSTVIGLFLENWGAAEGWFVPSAAKAALETGSMDSTMWAKLAVTTLIWTLIPAAVGVWRWMTREAKTE